MGKFDGVNPCMRIEILVDPDSGDYQLSVDGKLEVLKIAMKHALAELENQSVVEELKQDYEFEL